MTKTRKIALALIATASIVTSFGSAAGACGLIACALEQVAPNSGIGETLDGANVALGHPAENAVVQLGNAYAPGLGTAAGAVMLNNNPNAFDGPQFPNGGFSPQQGGNGGPQPFPQQGNQQFQPVGFPNANQMVGNVCYTPWGGYSGPFNPMGMTCWATLPNGAVVQGVVGR